MYQLLNVKNKYFSYFAVPKNITHPAPKRRDDVVTSSFCMFQQCRRYVFNETPNDVSMERRKDVSVECLHKVLLEHRDDVSRGRNNDVYVSTTSQTSLK